MNKKILITDYAHPVLANELTKVGYDVTSIPKMKYELLPDVIADYVGIIINSKIIMNKDMIDQGVNLEFIGRLGSGLDIIDLPYADKKGIKVISTPEGNRNAVAEHALGMLLALSNNLLKADSEVRRFEWNRENNRGFEIKNKVIGLVGFGNTGQSLGSMLSPWAQHVIYYDKYLLETPKTDGNIERVDLEYLQSEADIISLHLPLTAETNKMVNAEFIAKCKDGFILINTSRGDIVETRDLIAGLQNKKLFGACLDVFENEKPENYTNQEKSTYEELYKLPNTVFSPHIAGWTHESLQKIGAIMAKKIIGR